jgi:hypothetical protein
MVASEASDLYASDTYTWSATSLEPGAKNEPAINNHSPSGSRVCNKCASLEHFVMDVLMVNACLV